MGAWKEDVWDITVDGQLVCPAAPQSNCLAVGTCSDSGLNRNFGKCQLPHSRNDVLQDM